jgi:hypothetical protein
MCLQHAAVNALDLPRELPVNVNIVNRTRVPCVPQCPFFIPIALEAAFPFFFCFGKFPPEKYGFDLYKGFFMEKKWLKFARFQK